jgi:type IV pilus assembly protein PilQ
MSRAATRTRARRIWQSWLRQRPALIAVMALVAAAGAATVGAEAAGPRLNGIVARANARSTSVLIEASEPVAYSASRPDPRTVVVELLNVTTAGAVNRVGPSGQGVVEGVTVEQDDEAEGGTFARVTVKLTQPVPYAVRSARNVIEVELDPVQTPPTAAPQAAQPASVPEPAAAQDKPGTASADPMAALRQKVGAGQPPAAAQAPQAKPAQTPTAQATPAAPPSLPQGKQYTGHPVSLDFQGLDLRAVLRVFTEISGLNIVIDPAVQGTVDVKLSEVPWDQALDIILRANKLGWTLDGTIVRIAPLTVLADEEAQRRKLADEQALSGDLKMVTRALSYAKGDDIRPLLEKSDLLSKRGTVQFDTRTNTLIIRDLADRLGPIAELISTLDKPELQVEIEARIVRTTSNYARALGVTWGFTGRMAPDLGNTTGLAFPNSAEGTGSVTMPAAAASDITSQARLTLGSVNGSFNLDVALSALEKDGKAKVLLQPRVLMQNNVEGYIMRGQQIPYTTAQAGSAIGTTGALLTPATVQFKDAALSLKVTPQVTASGTVFMDIAVENSFPNYAVTRPEQPNPAIDTQRATTRVLVPDGATTVIGGIYETSEDLKNNRTPALSRIPLLGWLFKNENRTTENNELLIFITPRIIRVQ